MKFKKKVITFLLVGAITATGSVFAFGSSTATNAANGTANASLVITPFAVSWNVDKTTGTLPKNVDGTQGKSQASGTLTSTDNGKSGRVTVSDFKSGMTSVNVSVKIGGSAVASKSNMTSGDYLDFYTPSSASGKSIEVIMSTNSSSAGTCRLVVN